MKKYLSFYSSKIIILAAGVFSSCIDPNGIPKDLYIRIEGSPSQPGAGGAHVLTLTAKTDQFSERTFEWTLSLDNQVQRLQLSDSAVQRIVNELRRSRIFKLKNRYADYNILDGGTDVLTIRMNAREKVIQMNNSTPKELAGFFKLIYRPE